MLNTAMLPASQPAVYILLKHILSTAFSMGRRVTDVRINPPLWVLWHTGANTIRRVFLGPYIWNDPKILLKQKYMNLNWKINKNRYNNYEIFIITAPLCELKWLSNWFYTLHTSKTLHILQVVIIFYHIFTVNNSSTCAICYRSETCR